MDTVCRKTMTLMGILACLATLLHGVATHAQAPAPIFRLATFEVNGDQRLGATSGNGENDVLDVHNGIRYLMQAGAPEAQNLPYVPADMRTLVSAGPRATAAIRQVYQALSARRAAGTLKDPGGQQRLFYPHTAVKFLSPVTNPSKIYGFAGNYPREGNLANPKFPSSFFKSVASLGGHGDIIDLAGLVTTGVHEPELSLVINRRAKHVSEANAFDYVFGYKVCNDVSARELAPGNHPT